MAQLRNYQLKLKPSERIEYAVRGNVISLVSSSARIYFTSSDSNSSFYLDAGQDITFLSEQFLTFWVSHNEVTDVDIVLSVSTDARINQQKKVTDVLVANTLVNPANVHIASSIPLIVSGVTLTASNVTLTQKPQTTTGASYLVTAAGVNVSTAANDQRKSIHFRNTSLTTDCYLAAFGAASKGLCPILLHPNQMLLIDDRSASAQWKAFSDGVDLTLAIQESTE